MLAASVPPPEPKTPDELRSWLDENGFELKPDCAGGDDYELISRTGNVVVGSYTAPCPLTALRWAVKDGQEFLKHPTYY